MPEHNHIPTLMGPLWSNNNSKRFIADDDEGRDLEIDRPELVLLQAMNIDR